MSFKVNLGGKTRTWAERTVDRIVLQLLQPRRTATALLTFAFGDGQSTTGELKMQQLGDANFVIGRLQPIDSRGNPVPLDKVEGIRFSGSDASLITVEQDLQASERFTINAVGPLGTCQFQWRYDNLTGEGGDVISGVVDIEVIAGQGVGGGVTFDEQQPQ